MGDLTIPDYQAAIRRLAGIIESQLDEEGNPMKDRNIFAYTALLGADFPEFISINRKDDRIEITVRSQGSGGNQMGLMTLPQDKLDELIYALRGARINPLRGSAAEVINVCSRCSGKDPDCYICGKHSEVRNDEVRKLLAGFYKTVDVMKSARNKKEPMSIWADDMKAVEDVMLFLESLRDSRPAQSSSEARYPRAEHSYNGACYGLCGKFVEDQRSKVRNDDAVGWLIEKDDPPVYAILSDDYDEHWTTDSNQALRFARREDAKAYSDHIGWTSPPIRVVEHMWPVSRPAQTSPTPEKYWEMMYTDLLKRVDAGEFASTVTSTGGQCK